VSVGALSGEVRAAVIEDLSEAEADRVLTEAVEPSAHLLPAVFRSAVEREMRRTKAGGIDLLSKVAVFG
jgi:hypothetical protein